MLRKRVGKIDYMRWLNKNKPAEDYTPRRRLSDSEVTSDDLKQASESHPFLKNRTITGSRSQNIVSANENEAQLASPRSQLHALKKQRRSIGKRLMIFALGATLILLTITQLITGIDVSLYGQVGAMKPEQKERYRKVIDSYLEANPLQRLRFLFDNKLATDYMRTNGLAEVYAINSIVGSGFDDTMFVVKPREPVASWTIENEPYFVDTNGIIFSENYYASPSVKIVDESGLAKDKKTQQAVTSQRFLAFVGRAVALFDKQNITIQAVTIPSGTARQVDLIVKDGPRLKFTIDRPVGEQAEDAIRSVVFLRNENRSAQYIDVRVSRRAYYKE